MSDTVEEILHRSSRVEWTLLPPSDSSFESASLLLDYPLLGHRQYVHGSSMLEGMMNSIIEFTSESAVFEGRIKQFKIIHNVETSAVAVAMRRKDALRHPTLGDALARLDLDIGSDEYTSLLFPHGKIIHRKLAGYDAADYVTCVHENGDGATVGEVCRLRDYVDLVRAINECNRQATVAGFPHADWSKRVRWAYLSNMPMVKNELVHHINMIIFRLAETVDLGKHRFEIKDGFFNEVGASPDFKICFFIELPENE